MWSTFQSNANAIGRASTDYKSCSKTDALYLKLVVTMGISLIQRKALSIGAGLQDRPHNKKCAGVADRAESGVHVAGGSPVILVSLNVSI